MTTRCLALGTALLLSAACGSSRSQYARQASLPGELVWRFDDRLQVTRDGQVVAEADRWSGLAEAVACVPRASAWAAAATARHDKGTTTLWAGLVGGIVAVAAGAVLVATDTSSNDRILGGVMLMAGGLAVGTGVMAAGDYIRTSASVRGIDAVNLYNDQRAAGVRCVR